MATELELKFTTEGSVLPEPEDLTSELQARGLSVLERRVDHIKDRYFDDARASLSRAGLAVRRRMHAGRMLATLKTRGVVTDARHMREEIELPLPERGWPAEIAERLSMVTDPDGLKPYTVLDSVRTVWMIADASGQAVAELSFDLVTASFQSGTRKVEFTEIEVEAQDDSGSALPLVEEALAGLVKLAPSPFTKLERAQALLMGAGM